MGVQAHCPLHAHSLALVSAIRCPGSIPAQRGSAVGMRAHAAVPACSLRYTVSSCMLRPCDRLQRAQPLHIKERLLLC